MVAALHRGWEPLLALVWSALVSPEESPEVEPLAPEVVLNSLDEHKTRPRGLGRRSGPGNS